MKRIFTLLLLSFSMFLSACNEKTQTNRIYVFSQPNCSHCISAHAYMTRYYKNYDIGIPYDYEEYLKKIIDY